MLHAIGSDAYMPTLQARPETHTLEPRRIRLGEAHVLLILRVRRFSQVVAAIVESVTILMVDQLGAEQELMQIGRTTINARGRVPIEAMPQQLPD